MRLRILRYDVQKHLFLPLCFNIRTFPAQFCLERQNVDVSVSVLSTYIYKITSKCKTSKPISLIELIFYYDKLQTCGEPSISKYKNPKLGEKADFSTPSLMFAFYKHFVVKIQSVEFSSEREARLHFPLNTTCVSFTDAEQRKLKISAACAHRRTM